VRDKIEEKKTSWGSRAHSSEAAPPAPSRPSFHTNTTQLSLSSMWSLFFLLLCFFIIIIMGRCTVGPT